MPARSRHKPVAQRGRCHASIWICYRAVCIYVCAHVYVCTLCVRVYAFVLGISQSLKEADATHPYGYATERYVCVCIYMCVYVCVYMYGLLFRA